MGPEDPKGERRKPNTSTTSAVVAPLELADQEQFFVHILYTPDGPSFVFLFPPTVRPLGLRAARVAIPRRKPAFTRPAALAYYRDTSSRDPRRDAPA